VYQATNAERFLNTFNRDIVANAVRVLSKDHFQKDKFGGVLTILIVDPEGKQPNLTSVASTSVGELGANAHEYVFHVSEKIKRLRKHHYGEDKHIASSQSAKPPETWGGCIVFSMGKDGATKVFISFSGAPWEVDEAIVLVLGEKLGLTPPAGHESLESYHFTTHARQLLDGVEK
jgi:hypothetical protein